MKKAKLKILITGARSFIGRNLVEYFKQKDESRYHIFYPYHAELELLDTHKVKDFIEGNCIDIVVHCANVGGSRKTAYDVNEPDIIYKNLRMFFNLAQTLDSGRRMIFLGSGAEYNFHYYTPRMAEDYFGLHIPEDAYGFSKYVSSKYIEKSGNIVNLRLFGVYGKYEDYEYKFISNAIVKNLLGLPVIINQNVYFDYLYINDLVRIIEYFIEHKVRHKFYNVATGKTIDLLTIAQKINHISDRQPEIIVKNKGRNTEYSADNTRLLKELKGYNFTPFDKTLKELRSWYKSNLDKIDRRVIEKDEYIKYCRTKI